jgi:hypothetical protein
MLLAEYKQGSINDAEQVLAKHGLFDRVIFRCVIGSQSTSVTSRPEMSFCVIPQLSINHLTLPGLLAMTPFKNCWVLAWYSS